ncbi:MAG TPA: hypothetical protein VH951_08545, partial [Dehalococcoidia bacterium]
KEAESRGNEMRERFQRELALWQDWWRDVLQAGAGETQGLLNPDRAASLAEEGKLYRASEVVGFLRALLQTREYLQANVDAQLALEVLAMDVPQPRVASAARP